ncbi:ankyrin repeat domain-containing protein [Salinisphaera sp. G21_0]|uniref:ankyrin repeat domain-containing protein n=1 Tax=Salinisphaera sp. G21_0 TaxID=2821094 RepID=UPI001ADC3F06|nr:ankyrin repeat domain-containing protein [Salinisphaera sp. G21_0]MBO9483963.1 ankyrin repeat domain-containing protein [Salinisphaera sp. G21_0]
MIIDKSGKIALHYAISAKDEKDLDTYKKCLNTLCDEKHINELSIKNIGLVLRFAIEENHDPRSLEKLFDKMDFRVKIEDGKTLLHFAVENGNHHYLKKILEKPGSAEFIDIKDDKSRTPLHYAAFKANIHCIILLLYEEYEEKGKQANRSQKNKLREKIRDCINDKDDNGDTALLLAAQNSDILCIKELIKANADVCEKDKSLMTLMHHIARSNNKDKNELLDDLLEGRIKIKDITKTAEVKSYTPLQYAAYYGNIDFVKKILDKSNKFNRFEKKIKSKIIGKDKNKETSLLNLAIKGDQGYCLVKLLEFIKADDTTLSEFFLNSAIKGKYSCLKELNDFYNDKLDYNHKCEQGMSALHYVVKHECWVNSKTDVDVIEGYRSCLDLLLRQDKVKINSPNNQKRTPLHLAAQADNIYCLTELLKKKEKIDINAKDNSGCTAFHLAAKAKSKRCFNKLHKQRKLDKNAEDQDKKTAFSYANW